MKFKIHRGTKEIGGSCVEIWTKSTRIVVDFGMPLVNSDQAKFDSRAIDNLTVNELMEKGILPDVDGLYENNGNTSMVLSHAHQDHYGLVKYVNSKCKIYLGQATKKLIEITNIFTNQDGKISNCEYFEYRTIEEHKIPDIELKTQEEYCPKCNSNTFKIVEMKSIIEDLGEIAESTGTNVEIISSETEEGEMLKSTFGGLVAILRYKLNY